MNGHLHVALRDLPPFARDARNVAKDLLAALGCKADPAVHLIVDPEPGNGLPDPVCSHPPSCRLPLNVLDELTQADAADSRIPAKRLAAATRTPKDSTDQAITETPPERLGDAGAREYFFSPFVTRHEGKVRLVLDLDREEVRRVDNCFTTDPSGHRISLFRCAIDQFLDEVLMGLKADSYTPEANPFPWREQTLRTAAVRVMVKTGEYVG